MSRSCSTRAGWWGTCTGNSACRLPQPPRWLRSPTASPRRCAGSLIRSRSRGWTSRGGSARTTSCTSTWPGSPPRRAWCSSGGRRRKPRCSGPRSAATLTARRYPWIVKTTGLVNHFYFYCVDADFGPFFLKFCSYFPYNAKLCINGNHWAQRQAPKRASRSRRSTTASSRSATPPRCSESAIGWDRSRSTRCCANGWQGSRIRSPPPTGQPVTATTSRSCRPSSP